MKMGREIVKVHDSKVRVRNHIICGDAFTFLPSCHSAQDADLVICDPPYGKIVKENWDYAQYRQWMRLCISICKFDCTIVMWGGIGKQGNRPFLTFSSRVETKFPDFQIKNWITWGKRRAYGVKDNYLFTREECLILTRGKPTFNVPLLDMKRGYAGYNPDYPALSEFKRRTNVWTDITELFKGKVHPCEKPDRLYEVLIETHSNPGDLVIDPCAGSCLTDRVARRLGRNSICVEKEQSYIDARKLES